MQWDKKSRHVALMVTTYRRPMGLQKTLESLAVQDTKSASFEIHVIDNDCDSYVASIVKDFRRRTRNAVHYHAEPQRGVASARNRALNLLTEQMDYIAFIDDDEIASRSWLTSLVETAERFGASIVQGPVEPMIEGAGSDWFRKGRFTALGPFREGDELRFGFSGNVLLSRCLLQETGIRFHSHFDRSGGEDQHFFMVLMQQGYRIVTSRDAIVFETIPRSRVSLHEWLKRRFRVGATLTLAWRLLRQDAAVLPHRMLIGVGHVGFGMLSCLLPWRWQAESIASHLGRIAYGIGQVVGAGGLIGASYSVIHQSEIDRAEEGQDG